MKQASRFFRAQKSRNSGKYLCRALVTERGALYFNSLGGSSSVVANFRNIKTGWTLTANGVIQYVDGTIEWEHSTSGRFEDEEGSQS